MDIREGSLPVPYRAATRAIKRIAPTPYTHLQSALDEDRLEKQEKEYVGALTRLNSEIRTVRELTGEFRQLVKQGKEARLDQWRERVARSGFSELKSFAEGLMNDEMAVREALRSKWSNGQTEGQINRLKMIKRHMYGRGNLDLLRARVLHAV